MLERNGVQIKEEGDFEEFFGIFDTSGNGLISYDEFAQLPLIKAKESGEEFQVLFAITSDPCQTLKPAPRNKSVIQ